MKMERVKPYNRIAVISMQVYDEELCALKLIDDEDTEVFNTRFNTRYPSDGKWKKFEIPEG